MTFTGNPLRLLRRVDVAVGGPLTTMAKGAKVKPDDLPPLGPPPPESDKKAMKAWVKETNKRKKAKVKVDMKAKKQRDKEEKKRKKNMPLREAPTTLNNQTVHPFDVGEKRGRFNVSYGMNAFGRASYLKLIRGMHPPSPCSFPFPRWFVVQYKTLKIYEYKADSKPKGDSLDSLRKPLIEIKLNIPETSKLRQHKNYTVKVTPWKPLVDVAKLLGDTESHYYIKITKQTVGPDESFIVDCINEKEQQAWIDILEAACERDVKEAYQAEVQDRDTRAELLKSGMNLSEIEQEMMGGGALPAGGAAAEQKGGSPQAVKQLASTAGGGVPGAKKSASASEEPEGGVQSSSSSSSSSSAGGADPAELALVKEQLAAQQEEMALVRESVAKLEADIAALQQEKERAIADLEALLATTKEQGEAKQREAAAEVSKLKKTIDDREKEISNAASIKRAKANEFQRMLAAARERKTPAKKSAPPPV